MNSTNRVDGLLTPLATKEQLAAISEHLSVSWPGGLKRFCLFKRTIGHKDQLFRAIAWDPTRAYLLVLPIEQGKTPDGSHLPVSWHIDGNQSILSEISILTSDIVRPPFMAPDALGVPASCMKGLPRRNAILNAFLMIDSKGCADPRSFVIDDRVLFDPGIRSESVTRVCQQLGKSTSYRAYLFELLTKYLWFGGGDLALLNLGPWQGGPGKSRVGINAHKPGPLSLAETRARTRSLFQGKDQSKRQNPVRPTDLSIFLRALTDFWACERASYKLTYTRMIARDYAKSPVFSRPTFSMFRHHASSLIPKHDLKQMRNGDRLSAQYNNARVGQSSDLTQGVIEILDVDGFVPKRFIVAHVNGKIEPIQIVVVFCISRLSGAVLGYEISLKAENSQSFERCVASAFLPKDSILLRLGLPSLPGLVHGNFDGIFVDNGAGASEQMTASICNRGGILRSLPPPGRGDLKGVVEGLNNIMIRLIEEDADGYTRAQNVLAKDTRRRKSKATPMELDDFERYLLKAINFYNLTTNKKRLRSHKMREAGVEIYPAAIFKYTQSQRRGDAAHRYTQAEIFDIFVPWVKKKCRKGLVHYLAYRYTSPELVAFFNEHARSAGKVVSPFVEVKRPAGGVRYLIWKNPDGSHTALEMIEEDARNIGEVTWQQAALAKYDDKIQVNELESKRIKMRGTLTVDQHENVRSAEHAKGNPLASIKGITVKAAKASGTQARLDEQRRAETEAYQVKFGSDVIQKNVNAISSELTELEKFEIDFYKSLG